MSQDINIVYSKIITALLQAAKEAIPRGCRKKFRPYWSKKLELAVNYREKARRLVEKHPTPNNKTQYNRLTAKIKLLSKQTKKDNWAKKCGELNMRRDGKKAWPIISHLSGVKRRKNAEPITTSTEQITKSEQKAEAFNKHFANVNKNSHARD